MQTPLMFIRDWITNNHLDVTWVNDIVFTLDRKDYVCVVPKDGKVLDAGFELILSEQENEQILIENYCFAFGGQVYWSPVKAERVELNLLKYIGKAKDLTGFPYLGVHSGHELCVGSREYFEWCQKARFFDVGAIGISEAHTLAGAMKFQQAAGKAGLKAIIGETVRVRWQDDDYRVKLYVRDETGWQNLLRIHRRLNVDNLSSFVEEEFLLDNSIGLFVVIQSDTKLQERMKDWTDVFYQFDPVQYAASRRDLECLGYLRHYLRDFRDSIPLALICDSYYLDQEDHRVKRVLNFIGKGSFEYQSTDQYFKSLEDVVAQALEMFTTKGEDFAFGVVEEALEGVKKIADGCNFKINTKELHLPKYEMTEEEAAKYETSEDLFWAIIREGLDKKIAEGRDEETYLERIAIETDIILRGHFVDYFLILRDVVNWAESNGVMVGTGRGSVGGSIVAHFCNLTKVDAIEYGLIFERFLNESRIGKGLPDIDLDFESGGRDSVKRYMEQRFGVNNVASIGTYGTLKTKAAFRDLLRFHGEQPQIINYYATMIEESNDDFTSLFYQGAENEKLKKFINDHAEVVSDVPLILGQPKSASVHASGVLITPKDKEIYDWFPCKVIDGILVSEWEGVQLDEAGFLKADILGLQQLDKIHAILKLIKEPIDINAIDLEDPEVYDLFHRGWTQDVFQFGTDGLSAYCREVKPDNILELAAINALYRPGAMDSGAHTDYVRIKFGKKEAEYDWGTEEILRSTFGLMIYQEQAIKIVQAVGGFTLTEGDAVRKATGKKQLELMKSYKDKFVAGAIANGCPEFEANKIWAKIELFAGYSFNLSHAVAYSVIGYQTQWLKKYYPLEFWTVSLQMAKDEEIPKRISEMSKSGDIIIAPPDINKSRESFYTDWENNTIYWSLSRINQVGDVALKAIMEEREKGGKFFSIEEFVKRVKVNTRVTMHLIYSGCFDELYQISTIEKRFDLMQEWAKCTGNELDIGASPKTYTKFFWYSMQKKLSGSGTFDYNEAINEFAWDVSWQAHEYAGPEEVNSSEYEQVNVVVAGILVDIVKRKTKKGEMGKLTLDHNNNLIEVVVWHLEWVKWRKDLESNLNNGIIINGRVLYDKHNKKNCVYSTEMTVVVSL